MVSIPIASGMRGAAGVELALLGCVEVHLGFATTKHSNVTLHDAADHHPKGGTDSEAGRDEACQLVASDGDAEMESIWANRLYLRLRSFGS